MNRGRLGFVLILGSTMSAGGARAAASDYRFDPVTATVERGVAVTLKVEVRARSRNGLVQNVAILEPRVDRSPDGRANESHPAFFAPSLDSGIYSFRADLPTDGNWALTFMATIPGEAQPVPASVTYKVVGPGLANPAQSAPVKAPAPKRSN